MQDTRVAYTHCIQHCRGLMNTFIRPSMDNQKTDKQIYTDKNSTNIQVKMSITHIKP